MSVDHCYELSLEGEIAVFGNLIVRNRLWYRSLLC